MQAKRLRIVVVALSCVGVTVSPNAMAAPADNSTVSLAGAVRDVALHEGGVLVGQMLDAQGRPITQATVAVQKAGKKAIRVQTDTQGKFKVAGLTGGVHQVATIGQQGVYRLWMSETAPPSAQQGLMLVRNTEVVRGQCGCGTAVCDTPTCGTACGSGCGVYGRGAAGGGLGNWMANHPMITAGAIATAIAVPLAVDDDDDPPATP